MSSTAPTSDAPGSRVLPVLEEEREFCLRSLRDLEAEHDAGDIDDRDYLALRDDYTVRAAEVIRQIALLTGLADDGGSPDDDAGGSPGDPGRPSAAAAAHLSVAATTVPMPDDDEHGQRVGPDAGPATAYHQAPERRASRWRRPLFAAAALAIVAGGVGWALEAGSGTRLSGENVSGIEGESAIDAELLAAQTAVDANKPVTAMDDYQKILSSDSTDPEALTGEGAILVATDRASLVARGVVALAKAESADVSYVPAYYYLGVGLTYLGDKAKAGSQLKTYLADQPSSALAGSARSFLAYDERTPTSKRSSR